MDTLAVDPGVALAGEGRTPLLSLDGFSGPLGLLLTLARTQQLDLAQISLSDLLDQLTVALQLAAPHTSLGQKADWVVMAAWLLQLRAQCRCEGCLGPRLPGLWLPGHHVHPGQTQIGFSV